MRLSRLPSRFRKRRVKVTQASPTAVDVQAHGFSLQVMAAEQEKQAVVNYCRALANQAGPVQVRESANDKDFWRLLVTSDSIDDHPLIANFARSPLFVECASAYLGERAVLSGVTLMHSFPRNGKPKHSQLWHLDADDHRLVTLYLYCSDVDSESGPFELVPKTTPISARGPRWLRRHGLTDEQLFGGRWGG